MADRNAFPAEVANDINEIVNELQDVDENTDDIENKLDSVISELQDVEVDVENVDVNTDQVETQLSNVIAELQDIEADAESIDSLLDELEDALQSVATDELRTRYVDPRDDIGELTQTDFGFLNAVALDPGGEVEVTLEAPGGTEVNGQAKSTGQYSLKVEWLDLNDNVIRREGIASNREGDVWSNYSLDAKSPFVSIVVVDESSNGQTVTLSAHYI